MIVGTAGHVNHGKTTLVEALTGVCCDRLEEERSRGMTIELGFAPWTLPDGRRVSVIDVPGHARFARTMAAGALGVEVALLVVAADEGFMPQTHEHIAACRVLGVKRAIVALTRIDRVVDPATSVRFVRGKLDATCFAGSPIVRVCAPMGEGLRELSAHLASLPYDAASHVARPLVLPVDRVFSQRGFGCVVTGSLMRGSLSVGDRVALFPSGRSARVRTLHVHGEAVERASARTRVALNLADVSPEDVPRGTLIAAPGQAVVGRVFDAEIEWLAHNRSALRRARSLGWGQGPVRARATVVCDPPIEPGQVGVGRVHLDREIALVGGLHFVLRGGADRRHGAVVGGGKILDAKPPRRRAGRVRQALADAASLDASLGILLAEAAHRGVEPSSVGARLGRPPLPDGPRLFAERTLASHTAELIERVREFVEKNPGSPGMAVEQLPARAIRAAAIKRALESGALTRAGATLRPSDYIEDPSPKHALAKRTQETLRTLGLRGPREMQLAEQLGVPLATLRPALELLEQRGALVRSQGLCFDRGCLNELKAAVITALREQSSLPFSFVKTRYGLSRKFAMPLWTWLDRQGVTVRNGDKRIAGPAAKG